MKVSRAGSLMVSAVMLLGLLQLKNSNFEGVTRRKSVAVGRRFLGEVSSQLETWIERRKILERYVGRQQSFTKSASKLSWQCWP